VSRLKPRFRLRDLGIVIGFIGPGWEILLVKHDSMTLLKLAKLGWMTWCYDATQQGSFGRTDRRGNGLTTDVFAEATFDVDQVGRD